MSEEIAEVIAVEDEPGTDLEVRHVSTTLFGTDNPALVVQRATEAADALAAVIENKKLYTTIKGRKHVHVEGWTLLGAMVGVSAKTEWTRRTTDDKGQPAWEARVVALRNGQEIAAREAMCSRSESKWEDRDDYAIKSMAQTRATSGALSQALRFIVVLAGFEGTPEPEMPREQHPERRENAPQVNVPRSWAQVLERLQGSFPDAEVWLKQAKEIAEEKQLPAPTFFQRMCGLVLDTDGWDVNEFPPVDREEIQDAFAKRLDGIVLPGPEAPGGEPE